MTMMNKFGQRYRCLLPQTGLDDDIGSDNLSGMAAGLTINLFFFFSKRLLEIAWGLIYNPHKERGRICIVIYLSGSFQLFPCLEIGPLTLILGCKKPTEYNLVNDQTWRLVRWDRWRPRRRKEEDLFFHESFNWKRQSSVATDGHGALSHQNKRLVELRTLLRKSSEAVSYWRYLLHNVFARSLLQNDFSTIVDLRGGAKSLMDILP